VTYDQPFEIKLDPGLQISEEDLQLQFKVTAGLVKMQSAVNAAIAKLATVDSDKKDNAGRLLGELARPRDLGRSETGPRLKEQVDALFTMTDGVNAAPTAAQTRYYEQLQAEFQQLMTRVEALVGSDNRDSGGVGSKHN
jgi:hypothetical protein